ncbi:MAG: SOS response-associated peptidase [Propionibacteriaceae bacterium]|jgi:putative SOS response-associated peptidase YedK|nr:SOS response-associated peptidase [Propionibacteriaceae bacterium]
MCGRFSIDAKVGAYIEELVYEYGMQVIDHLEAFFPNWDVKPTQTIPVIFHSEPHGGDVVAGARWGYIPTWAKSLAATPKTLFNARSESAMTKEGDGRASIWRAPLTKGQRCLIPASGYYEWTGEKKNRVPHWIHPATGILMFAGLYGWWTDPARSPDDIERTRLTATILTMESVPELASIHDRNPVALPPSAWWGWISPDEVGDQTLVDAMVAASRPILAGLQAGAVLSL